MFSNAYCSKEYSLEIEGEDNIRKLEEVFGVIRRTESSDLIFRDDNNVSYEILRFLADNRIPVIRFEHIEPSLEKLFLEVVDK